ncbi:NADH-quinone oxidoreductase subunit K [Capsulimonas corticalis]|uniref:NADH-quinone oxidoreductase subunit K n=1 Tax=Capsulimonas corticalis TaxID=2219043 RepID=A0A402CYG9_9BACT|nr:NADH-quinone oxidoreductase subunit NuoK [Capsulimonas corticalis]BDI31365.1 NADH-quinone oxidoreductase subunit K [Capsulimonas corticalis]
MVPAVPLNYYLVLSAILFTIGVVGVLIKRNPITIFMCVELMLNAVNITLVAFSRYQSTLTPAGGYANPRFIDGQMMVLFVFAVAAAEVAVGLGILVSIFRNKMSINVDEIDLMKG